MASFVSVFLWSQIVQVQTQEGKIIRSESEVGSSSDTGRENVGSESEVGAGLDTGRGNHRV
ncbi:hypothetical protein BK139_14300 [Paenibacillus sp. FSL R5-0490]|nr:hypothetical protein BK139_14300 [Paenibacillus sp. FSL R5-0490]